jgi:hypothetical protein
VKKTNKQKDFIQPRSHNLTHLHYEPIDIQATYRIGICGLRIPGNSKELTSALREVALKSFGTDVNPKKLMLMAGRLACGHGSGWPTAVRDIAQIAVDARVPILFELESPPNVAGYTAVLPNGERLALEIYQLFAKSECANRHPELVEELLRQCGRAGERSIHICGITLGLLICGENNVLANEQGKGNRPYVRFHGGSTLFPHLRLIFNGAHTKMGNWGKLERRFEFLSSGKRWALYATNNGKGEWGASTLRAYYDGSRIATSKGPEPNCRVPACICTSKNDRCRILTLDIPGSDLQ